MLRECIHSLKTGFDSSKTKASPSLQSEPGDEREEVMSGNIGRTLNSVYLKAWSLSYLAKFGKGPSEAAKSSGSMRAVAHSKIAGKIAEKLFFSL
jgi:hypothetical protein